MELTRSLLSKHTLGLNGLAISVFSQEDFRQSRQLQEGLRQTYFTKDELNYCKNRVASLAGRFAAKMAIREALQKQIPWNDMSILSSQTGEPILLFTGKINPHISISISHEEDLVTAFAAFPSQGNTVAVGIDAASISRISALLSQTKIMQKILTPQELDEIKGDPIIMAEKWSGKEAVSKAIGIGIWHGASLQDIEILTHKGKTTVNLHGKVLQQALVKGLRNWTINYIYDKKFVIAAVLATS